MRTAGPQQKPLSEAAEDCLKAIWSLQSQGQAAATNALAERLHLTPGTVTTMVKRLAALRLVDHAPYHGVTLTDAGRKVALEIVRHHRLLELYLHREMGYPWDQVHDEAEALEHSISEEFEDRVAEMLGHPTTDPHGDPIPTKEGDLVEAALVPLTELAPGQRAVIARVRDGDPAVLRSLARRGLVLDVEIEALPAPDDGPLRVVAGSDEQQLSSRQAGQVFVRLLAAAEEGETA